MKRMTKGWVLIIGGVVLSPLLLLTLSLLNPMGLAFLTRFEIENRTGATIYVTPLGAVGSQGVRRTLPYYLSSFVCLPSAPSGNFEIAPGKSRAFMYDMDDIQFCEIVVKSEMEQGHRVMSTGLHPTEGQYRAPTMRHFAISDISALPSAEAFQLRAIPGKSRRVWVFYVLAGAGLLSPVFVIAGTRMRRSEGASPGAN
jgi:hypothetical protein